MCIDDTLQDPSVVSRSMFVSGSYQERSYIADICHNHTSSGGSFFSSWCTIRHRERDISAYFGQFGLFCCEFTHFLVYFLQA